MKKRVVLVVIVLAVVFILFSLALLYNFELNNGKLDLSGKTNGDNSAVKDNEENQNTTTQNSDEGLSDGVGGNARTGGGGGSGGSSEGGGGNSGGNNISAGESTCMLVRPGNLPDIQCSVNSITKNGVSLKIKNEMGDKIDVALRIDTCNPELREIVGNMNEKDFAFSCINQDYFNQALHFSYIIGNESRVEIGGFVAGSVG